MDKILDSTIKEHAEKIFHYVGEKENIIQVRVCVTRLRIQVLDAHFISHENLLKLSLVKDLFIQNDELHIVLGLKITDRVYEEFLKLAKFSEKIEPSQKTAGPLSWVQKIWKKEERDE